LAHHLEQSKDNLPAALIAHAEMLEHSAENLRLLASKAYEHDISIECADTHNITLSSPEESIVKALVNNDIVTLDEWFDYSEDEDFEEDTDQEV
jgi:hypothetical protein